MSVGFLILTGGIVGLATIGPQDDTRQMIFAGLAGIGFGSLIAFVVTAVQLAVPHSLIATATAVIVSTRAVAVSIFTAIYTAAFTIQLQEKLPKYIAEAATKGGLPHSSLAKFIPDLINNDQNALNGIAGVTPQIIAAGINAVKDAYADSGRIVYIIAAPFGLVAVISCWFMVDLKTTMDYKVEAPVERLTAKVSHGHNGVAQTV